MATQTKKFDPRTCEEIYAEVEKKFNAMVELANNDEDIEEARADVEAECAAYNKARIRKEYTKLRQSETPMLDAIKTYSVYGVRLKTTVTENGVRYDIDRRELRLNIKDLEDFCSKTIGADKDWYFKVMKFGYLMALRNASNFGKLKKTLEDNYYVAEEVKAIDLGETPTSNTQTLRLLQTVFDGILFEDNGKGLNKYKVRSDDVAYLDSIWFNKGKASNEIRCPKESAMLNNVVDFIHNVVMGKQYIFTGIKTK